MGVPGTDNETGLRQHSTGTVFYVDPNFPGVSDARDGTDPNSPLLTVATAISKCQPYRGDVIAVMFNEDWIHAAGTSTYTTGIVENVTLNVAGVRLVGIAPSSSVGVPWTVATSGGTAIAVTAMDCLIEGFAFTGHATIGGTAISAVWDGATLWADNLTVRHCLFDDAVDTAIDLDFTYYCDIHDNFFQECDLYGIYAAALTGGVWYTSIHRNYFIDIGTTAIALLGDPEYNDIYENHLFNTDAQNAAAATDAFITTAAGNFNTVHHNTLSCQNTVVAAGDYGDTCTSAGTDAWVQNYCMNGPTTLVP
jgi:hypothetical protein